MRYLKNIILFSLIFLFLISFNFATAQSKNDSIIINVGSSKIFVLINDKKDLEQLKMFDLNAVIDNLNTDYYESNIQSKEIEIIGDDTIVVEKQYNKVLVDSAHLRWINRNNHEWKKYHRKKRSNQNFDKDDVDFILKNQPWYQKKNRRVATNALSIDLGVNNYFDNNRNVVSSDYQHSVRLAGSWYVGINLINRANVSKNFVIEWGPSISWYNFKFDDSQTIVEKKLGITRFGSTLETEIRQKKSKLTSSFINFNVLPMFHSNSNLDDETVENPESMFRFGLGGYIGYRLGSHSKVKIENGDKEKNRDSFNLTNLRYGIRSQIGYKGLDFFVNYDLNPLFRTNRGPKLNAFSFGIIIM